ncbi:hypothetical protein OOT33_13595 [Sphingobium sp. DEHP117]|uniref:hypothetical protein n=1 Tax=Sphingobium sp. DEHP117 TaxID=2993436 RepID=UPI0027D64026|nr:hypothetical protein [Sphingobium sp. DEHP117]MDQ4421456.1 hypothetical protein [Sphingobium sp. DEHP117]
MVYPKIRKSIMPLALMRIRNTIDEQTFVACMWYRSKYNSSSELFDRRTITDCDLGVPEILFVRKNADPALLARSEFLRVRSQLYSICDATAFELVALHDLTIKQVRAIYKIRYIEIRKTIVETAKLLADLVEGVAGEVNVARTLLT